MGRKHTADKLKAGAIARYKTNVRALEKGLRPYTCPNCGDITLDIRTVKVKDEGPKVKVNCNRCGLKWEGDKLSSLQMIDYYNKVCDLYRSGALK